MAANTYPLNYTCFNSKAAKKTNRLVDYYEGRQLQHLRDIMDGKGEKGIGKRKQWEIRGMVPRTRNITKSIADKSGLLYNDPPILSIELAGSTDPITDSNFQAIMDGANWLESFQNIDVYTRVCKSIIVLLQKYIPQETTTVNGQYKYNAQNGDALLITLLHQGNACVKMNPQRTAITCLAFILDKGDLPDGYDTSGDSEDAWYYRLYTPTEIVDFCVDTPKGNSRIAVSIGPAADAEERIIDRNENPDGFVPACFFYDINTPRCGYWIDPPEDLLSLQEAYNLYITDLFFAAAWQMQQTMVITGDLIVDKNQGATQIPAAPMGHTPGGETWVDIQLYQQQQTDPVAVGGLGTVVKVGQDASGKSGDVKFVGPNLDLDKTAAMVDNYVASVASDWDVNINTTGRGAAQSGFQLIVEELQNLQLRSKRMQSAQAGMRRFYELLKELYPELPDGQLMVKFAAPALPVNQLEKENIATQKIADNRMSRIDYLMHEEDLTREEAEARLDDILTENKKVSDMFPSTPPPGTTEQGVENTSTATKPSTPAASGGQTNG